MRVKELDAFITERWRILRARKTGLPKPWTKDPILQKYRFCNVHREDDTVTKWIAENWRDPNADNRDNWFAMAVARWINWPDTLAAIGYPVPWNERKVLAAMRARRDSGQKVWTGAYMIGTQGNAKDKIDFIVQDVLTPMWGGRAHLRPCKIDSLRTFNDRLQTAYAMRGGFMGGQVIADIKYTDRYLRIAPDWTTFAVSGPGSRRGLNRVMGCHPDQKWPKGDALWWASLMTLREAMDLPATFHNQDLQNCLCEFDKYERVRLGEGKPRSLYPGV
jgi:5-hmdU DNA kinase-like protein